MSDTEKRLMMQDQFIERSIDGTVAMIKALVADGCTTLSDSVVVLTGQCGDDVAQKVTVAARAGCTCRKCFVATLRAVADAFGCTVVSGGDSADAPGPITVVH